MRSDVYDVVTSVLGIEGTVRGDELDFCCPVHPDRKPSAGVNLTKGVWSCFSCGAGGDLASLAAAVKGVPYKEARRLVVPDTAPALLSSLQRTVASILSGVRGSRVVPIDLPTYEPTWSIPYLLDRGFSKDTLRRYGVAYVEEERLPRMDGESFAIRDYAALPIRDSTGRTMAYCYRACHEGDPRYIYTPGVKIGDLWFGEQVDPEVRHVVITEGAIDSMWVSQAGHKALGLLGVNGFNPRKVRDLVRFDSVTLFLDRDSSGIRAVEKIGREISHRVPTRVARYPRSVDVKDPQDLSLDQVSRAVEGAVQFDSWIIRRGRGLLGAKG